MSGIRIGLIHGQTFDLEDHQTTFPIERNAAVEPRTRLSCDRDTHGYRDVEPDAKVPTIYPGAPEATKFGENHSGHVAMVCFPRDRARRALVDRETVAACRGGKRRAVPSRSCGGCATRT